ncbi:hypothetical protein LNQ45_15910, partial [Yersinia ruckeri]|uniref:hypothetical protein n=1 Tax=Yersinia ruckeri TaxID=29486 RepID=UPI0020BD6B62
CFSNDPKGEALAESSSWVHHIKKPRFCGVFCFMSFKRSFASRSTLNDQFPSSAILVFLVKP